MPATQQFVADLLLDGIDLAERFAQKRCLNVAELLVVDAVVQWFAESQSRGLMFQP